MRRCVQNKGLYGRLLAPPRRSKLFFQFGEIIFVFAPGSELQRESRIQKESGLNVALYAEISVSCVVFSRCSCPAKALPGETPHLRRFPEVKVLLKPHRRRVSQSVWSLWKITQEREQLAHFSFRVSSEHPQKREERLAGGPLSEVTAPLGHLQRQSLYSA